MRLRFNYPPGNLAGQTQSTQKLNRPILNLKCNILFTRFITTVTMVTHEAITIDVKFESHEKKKKFTAQLIL